MHALGYLLSRKRVPFSGTFCLNNGYKWIELKWTQRFLHLFLASIVAKADKKCWSIRMYYSITISSLESEVNCVVTKNIFINSQCSTCIWNKISICSYSNLYYMCKETQVKKESTKFIDFTILGYDSPMVYT